MNDKIASVFCFVCLVSIHSNRKSISGEWQRRSGGSNFTNERRLKFVDQSALNSPKFTIPKTQPAQFIVGFFVVLHIPKIYTYSGKITWTKKSVNAIRRCTAAYICIDDKIKIGSPHTTKSKSLQTAYSRTIATTATSTTATTPATNIHGECISLSVFETNKQTEKELSWVEFFKSIFNYSTSTPARTTHARAHKKQQTIRFMNQTLLFLPLCLCPSISRSLHNSVSLVSFHTLRKK